VLDTSLTEANAAINYLTQRLAQQRSEQLRPAAANLAAKPLPPHFKPDLGLHLIKEGGAAMTFRFPNVPVQKLGILPDGTIRWSGNITLAVGKVYICTFDVPRPLAPALARALGVDHSFLAPGGSFAPLTVVKVNSNPPVAIRPS
jgi:hypothetical protein